MKKTIIILGVLVLALFLVSCTQEGSFAGEAIKTQDARQCPNGCDLIKNLNRAVVVHEGYTGTSRSCNTVCENLRKICVDAEFSIEHTSLDTDEGGESLTIDDWYMAECSYSVANNLKCRCY